MWEFLVLVVDFPDCILFLSLGGLWWFSILGLQRDDKKQLICIREMFMLMHVVCAENVQDLVFLLLGFFGRAAVISFSLSFFSLSAWSFSILSLAGCSPSGRFRSGRSPSALSFSGLSGFSFFSFFAGGGVAYCCATCWATSWEFILGFLWGHSEFTERMLKGERAEHTKTTATLTQRSSTSICKCISTPCIYWAIHMSQCGRGCQNKIVKNTYIHTCMHIHTHTHLLFFCTKQSNEINNRSQCGQWTIYQAW